MKKKFYRDWLYALLVAARAVFRLLPCRVGIALAGFLGRFSFYLLVRERRKVINQLQMVFGSEKTESEIFKIATGVFPHYGKTLAELVYIDRIVKNIGKFVTIEGEDHFTRALAKGNGAICIASHLGNWELLGASIRSKGFPLAVVAKRVYFEKFNQILVEVRRRLGITTIYQDAAARAVLEVLKDNRILGLVTDQDIGGVNGVFVDFFNRPAYTPTAPVRFSKIMGAPIIPCFIIREGWRHRVQFCPPLELVHREDKQEEIRLNTQAWVSIQEKWIRRHPDQWVWNHRRWKTQPAAGVTQDAVLPNAR